VWTTRRGSGREYFEVGEVLREVASGHYADGKARLRGLGQRLFKSGHRGSVM
jgi:hypothetical protein